MIVTGANPKRSKPWRLHTHSIIWNKIDDFARLSILKSIFVKEWQENCRKELAFMSGKYHGFLLGDEFQFSHKKRQGGLSQSKMTTFIKDKFGFTDDQMKEMFGSEQTINVQP